MDVWSMWIQKTSGFCESKLFNNNGEWISSFTAIFIIYFGFLGIYQMPYPVTIWKIVFSLLFLNGIGSMLFHATLQFGWNLIDTMTMIIGFPLISYHCFNILGYKYFVLNKHIQVYFHYFSTLGSIIHMIFCLLFLALNSLTKSHNIVAIASALNSVLLAIEIVLAVKYLYKQEIKENKQFKNAINYLFKAILLMFIAALLWTITESLCQIPKYQIVKYFPAHSLWHIIMSLGLYNIGMVLMYMETFDLKCNPFFKTNQFYHTFIPILRLKKSNFEAQLPRFQPVIEISQTEILSFIDNDQQST
eukprot:312418_1